MTFSHSLDLIRINGYQFHPADWMAKHPEYSLPPDCIIQIYTKEYRIGFTEDKTQIPLPTPWPEGDAYIKAAWDDYSDINNLPNWKRWAWQLMNDGAMSDFLAQCPHHLVSFLIALVTTQEPDPEPIQSIWMTLKGQLSFPEATLNRWNLISNNNRIPIQF